MGLLVLGLCLPSSGEVLVYKYTQNGSFYYSDGTSWNQEKGPWKGYLVLDITYADGSASIDGATAVGYGTEGGDKLYSVNSLEGLRLVRVELGSKVLWIVIQADADPQVGGSLQMFSGSANARKVGTAEKQEVANKLSGTGLEAYNYGVEGGDLAMMTFSITLYPTWTYWANGDGEDEGGGNFEATTAMIVDYLERKGYVERPEDEYGPTQ